MLNWLGNSLSTALFGDKDEKPIRIPSGQFYQLDPTIKQSSILKYKDASLNLRRSQTEWQSQLIISRIYDDGEQEDPFYQDDDFIFLIDRHMLMSVQPCHDNTSPLSILFKDLNHSSRLYEFVADSTISNNAINTFVEMCYQRMFERSNHRQCDSQEELLKWTTDLKREGESISTRFQKPQHFLTPAKPITTPILHTQVTSIPQPITPSPLQQIKIEPLLVFETPLGDELISVMCQLYLYDLRVSQFVLMKELVSVKLLHSEKFAFSLSIESEDNSPYMAQPLDSEMNPVFNIEQLAFVWVYYSQETGMPLYTWSLKFNSHIPFDAFKEMFGRCLYETLNQDLFSKLKKDESKYVVDAYT